MRILYHHRTRAGDAQGVHIAEIVRALRGLGHEVAVVGPDGATPPAARDHRRPPPTGGRRALYEAMTFAYNVYAYAKLARAIESARPALIYERYALNTFCGIWASRSFRIPLLLEVNAPLAHEERSVATPLLGRLAPLSERWICSHAARTIAVSNAVRELLAAEGVPRDKLVVMQNAVDPQRFHPLVDGRAVRRRYGLGDSLVLGFVGWFRDWHSLDLLVEAARRLPTEHNDVRLLLVGDGPEHGSLARRVAELGLTPRTIFTGPVAHEEIPAHIAAIDIAVQPGANTYACPMKVFEYMGMARCIVAPDQPNIREILDHDSAALFRPGDLDHLETVLADLIGSAEKRQALSTRARQTVVAREYFWTANAKRVIDLASGLATAPAAGT